MKLNSILIEYNQSEEVKMADENIDYHIITLFQRLETMYKETNPHRIGGRLSTSIKSKYSMQVEIRTMEFWRYFIS